VVIFFPAAEVTCIRQERVAAPSIRTVHAPHRPSPAIVLRSGEFEVVAENIEQSFFRRDVNPVFSAVDQECEDHLPSG
jgi:hypothetical protein